MRYPVTSATMLILGEIGQVIREIRLLLRRVPAATIVEWDVMRVRFPTDDDVRQGFVSLCELDLLRLRAELHRFRKGACSQPVGDCKGSGRPLPDDGLMMLSSVSSPVHRAQPSA